MQPDLSELTFKICVIPTETILECKISPEYVMSLFLISLLSSHRSPFTKDRHPRQQGFSDRIHDGVASILMIH